MKVILDIKAECNHPEFLRSVFDFVKLSPESEKGIFPAIEQAGGRNQRVTRLVTVCDQISQFVTRFGINHYQVLHNMWPDWLEFVTRLAINCDQIEFRTEDLPLSRKFIYPLTVLRFLPFIRRTNFRLSSKSWGFSILANLVTLSFCRLGQLWRPLWLMEEAVALGMLMVIFKWTHPRAMKNLECTIKRLSLGRPKNRIGN